jgi:neutral ceramidase
MTALSRRQFLGQASLGAGAAALAGLGCRSLSGPAGALLVGASRRDITPPTWVPYLKSSGTGACAVFEGIHDPLAARAVVVDNGAQSIAILCADSIGYDNALLGPGRDFTAELRARIAARTKLRPESIVVASTHAHSTPETIGLTSFREVPNVPAWIEAHLNSLADVVVEAWKRRRPAQLCGGTTTVTGVARNRRILLKNGKLSRHGPVPEEKDWAAPAPVDEELSWLSFERLDGSTAAVLLNYTAHPVVTMVLPPVSADYPGFACRTVEDALPGAVCLFTNGAAGNINSIYVSSNHRDAESLGAKLSSAFLRDRRLHSGPKLAAAPIQSRSIRLTLESRDCPSVERAEELAAAQPTNENKTRLRLARKLAEGPIRAELQAIQLGAWNWICAPGEAFVETGLALKKAGASFVIGYANGWVGYLPIRRAYTEGGYEVAAGPWSRVAPGCAELLEASAKKLMQPFHENVVL